MCRGGGGRADVAGDRRPAGRSGRRPGRAGTVTAEYSGTQDFTYVYDPSQPAVGQQHGHFQWDEKVTVRPTSGSAVEVGGLSLSISGQVVSTYAPPNTAYSCVGSFSARRNIDRPHWPISINGVGDTGSAMFSVSALIPLGSTYTASSSPANTHCGIMTNGSANAGELPPSTAANDYFLTPLHEYRLDEGHWSKQYRIDYTSPYRDEHTHVRSTFTITGGNSSPPRQPPTPAPTPRPRPTR